MHTRKNDGGIFYVGIGNDDRPYNKRKRNKFWKSVVEKHGFKVTIFKTDMTWEQACDLEIKMIAFYGRRNLGICFLCNLTDGGEGSKGFTHSKETLKNLSSIRKQKIKNSNDTNVFGVKGFGLGKIDSTETRSKKSNSKMGQQNSFYNKTHTEESRKKMSEVHKGKTLSEETRKKISENNAKNNSKKVIDIVTNKIYDCLIDAANLNNINYSTLRNWLNPNIKRQNKSNLRWL